MSSCALILSGATFANAQSPDLITQNLTLPGSISAGQSVTFSGEVKNRGNVDAIILYPQQIGTSLTVNGSIAPALATLNSTDVALVDSGTLRTYRYSGNNWSQIGNTLIVSAASVLATLNSTDVALFDSGQLRTYRFNGTTWSPVGTGLLLGGTARAIAGLNSTDVAYFNGSQFQTYRFDGTTWFQVGTSLTVSGVGTPALAALNNTDVVLFDSSDQLRTYRWSGSSWSQVGTSLTVSGAGTIPGITSLSSTDVALINIFDSKYQLRTYRWSGSSWSQVGASLSVYGGFFSNLLPAITSLSGSEIAFIDSFSDQMRTYRFNGSSWSQVDNSLQMGAVKPALAALNSTTVALVDGASDQLRTFRLNGTKWSQVGNSFGVSGGIVVSPALAALNSTDVAFSDGASGQLRVYRWSGTNWSGVGNSLTIGASRPALATLSSTDVALFDDSKLSTFRWNGTDWLQVGNSLPLGNVNAPALAALNSTDVAFIESIGDELRTYRWNGTDWLQVGAGLQVSGSGFSALAALNSTNVFLYDHTGPNGLNIYLDRMGTFAWNGVTWFQVDNFSGEERDAQVIDPSAAVARLNNTDVAIFDAGELFTARTHQNPHIPLSSRFCVDSVNRAECTDFKSGIVVGYPDLSSLAAGASAILTSNSWIATEGSHTIFFCVDAAPGRVTESDEGLGTASPLVLGNCTEQSFIVGSAGGPDLTPTAFSVPSGLPGSVVSASVTVKNNGTTAVGAFEVGINMTTSMNCTAEQYTGTIASLAVGASKTLTISITLPTTAGSYTASAMADSDCIINTETSEANNMLSAPYSVGASVQPNLTITAFSVPNGFPGSVVSASVTVENNGSTPVGSFEVGIHRNKPTGMTCALETYARIVSSLAAGVATTVPISVTLPPLAASYTASAMVDSDCVITESNEAATDNTKQATYTTVVVVGIKPDLTAGAPTDPGVVSPGVNLAFMGPITNAVGAGNVSGSFNNLFQLDIDNDGGGVTFDVNLNAPTSISGLSAGQTKTTLPSEGWIVLPGTHAVRLCADLNSTFAGTIIESNEANNCGPTTVFTVVASSLPDLTITSFSVPNGIPNSVVSASVTVQNSGTSGVSAFEVGINRNKPTGMTCALEVYARTVASLAPGASQIISIPVQLPIIAGSYTASAMVDSDCLITESNEAATDNTRQASYVVSAAGASVGAVSPQSNDRQTSSRNIFRLLWSVITGKE